MARKVTTSPEALLGFDEAKKWLCQPGAGKIGLRRWQAIRDALRQLMRHPYIAPASPEIPDHRQLVVSGYRLIYQVNPDTGDSQTAGDVRIVAIFGPGQSTKWP
jgi:plasmid stabilization system protein ParE